MRPVVVLAALLLLAAPGAAQVSDPGGRRPERDLNNWQRPAPAPGFSYPECVCTNRGERVPLGGTACLRVDGREFTARCAESINVTIWRKLRDGCEPGPGS